MPQFIPLKIFSRLYSKQADLLVKDGYELFIERLSSEGIGIAEEHGYNIVDFKAFQNGISDSKGIVFHGWIENVPALKLLLIKGVLNVEFIDENNYLKHQLADAFKKFISPYLAQILLSLEENSINHIAYSYLKLLDADHCLVVEDFLFKPIQKQLDRLKEIDKFSADEQALVNEVKPLCSDDIVRSVNYLSRGSYAKKLSYVDGILSVIHAKACTVRFSNWILKQLENVELNHAHQNKIIRLREELREGKLKVNNKAKGRTPIRWTSLLSVIVILGLIGFAGYIIYFKPFDHRKDKILVQPPSFKDFSKNERIKIDSLLKEIDRASSSEDLEVDPSKSIIGAGTTLRLRNAFTNETMERIYMDLHLDAFLKMNYPQENCEESDNLSSLKFNKGIDKLHTKQLGSPAMLKNESDYDILVYVSENKKGGKVYAAYVASQEAIEFNIAYSNTLMIVAGKDYQPVKLPQSASENERPSDNFLYHFCSTDQNYIETINTVYQLSDEKSNLMKFIVTGSGSGLVHLIDIHNVLSDY